MDWITDPAIWASLATLTFLEIILGIDNVIFISVMAEKLDPANRDKARRLGLLGALVMRILLLLGITWVIGLTRPILTLGEFALSWRDIILLGGGLFLLAKGTHEIHAEVEGDDEEDDASKQATLFNVVVQIMLLDIIFSIDSVVTAVGMAEHVEVMIAAVVISIGVMLWASGPVAAFISRHPTVKMLALSFLLLVGVVLIADGLHFHMPRGYIYAAISFSILVEALNQVRTNRRRKLRAIERAKSAENDGS